jgi:hypothetical protein
MPICEIGTSDQVWVALKLRMGHPLVLAAALVLATAPASAAAAKPPSAKPVKPLAKAGSTLRLAVKGTGTTAFLLSTDRRRGTGDISLGSRTLRRPRTRLALRVPGRTALGAYRVLTCTPARSSRCRATKSRIAVTARPRPARIRPRLDDARAAAANVGRGGGTLSATGADGTRFTLAIPAGALLDPANVTLTPVASAGRLPMGARGLKAVEIGPAGLDLLKPASLAIVPPKRVARSRLTGVGFDNGGRQFHLTPVSPSGSEATLRVFELEGLGIASATSGARYRFSRTRMPTSLVDQLQQVAAAPRAPRGVRASQAGPEDELSAQLFAVALAVQALATSGNIDAAVIQFVPWDSLSLGMTGRYPQLHGWRALVAQGFRAGFSREIASARAACLVGDIRQMGRLLRFRDYLYTSLASLQLQDMRSVIDTVVSSCLRFELDYDVTITGANGYGEAVNARVTSTVPIGSPVPGDTDAFSGTAGLVVANYTVGPADCWDHTWNVSPAAPLQIKQMSVGILRSLGAEHLPAEIRMKFNLGSLDEQVTHTCDGDASTSYTDQQHAYDGVAAALLGGEAGSDFELNWTAAGSGSDYSSQTFTRSTDVDGSYTGTFTFRLRHTPN